jgi:hypothetical protein
VAFFGALDTDVDFAFHHVKGGCYKDRILCKRFNGGSTVPNAGQTIFQRHARMVTFVGAMIVVFTFLVRDVISDNLKDNLASLNAADADYLAALRDDAFRSSLTSIQQTVTLLLTDETMAKEKASTRAISNLGDLYLGSWNDADSFLSSALRFARNTKGADGAAKQLEICQQELSSSKANNTQRVLLSLRYSVKEYREHVTEAQSVDALNLVDESLKVSAIKTETEQVLQQVLVIARSTVERDKRYEARAKHSGYVLFALGWLLGLIGNLADGKSIAAE